nr:sterol O-acyltransferase 1-like [Leptinotarsa decemlineata]
MKLHSFIRTTAVTVYNYKSYTEKNLLLPTFTQYLYFLFAPTCIFRTDYPRTGRIRWKYIFFWFIEILCVIACVSFIFHKYFISAYEDFGIRRFSWKELIVSFLEHLLPAMMVYLSGFYLLFHSFQNIFAELLRFGDRHFYGDWWNCGKFSEYFQTWNVIVHDWLYIYLYKDMYEHVVRNKSVAKLTTFLVSGIVHEWALMNMFGYFFPAVFVFFMAFVMMSIFLKIPNASLVNTLFWLSLPLGCSLLISGYTLEFFARKNTSRSDDSLKNFLLPRWLTCDCIE